MFFIIAIPLVISGTRSLFLLLSLFTLAIFYLRYHPERPSYPDPSLEVRLSFPDATVPTSTSSDFNASAAFHSVLKTRADAKGFIILASVDSGFVEMAINLYESSLKKFKLDNYLFVSSDAKAAEKLTKHGIANFNYFSDKDAATSSDYRSVAFARKTHYKTKIVLDALRLGLTVLLTDVDIVFLKNPFPFFECKNCDLLISSDVSEGNSGFYLVKPTKAGIELHQRAWDGGMANPKKSNQKQIATVIKDMLKKKTLERKTLSLKTFPCGVVYFDQGHRMFAGDFPCQQCVIVHNNWIVSGAGKIYRFKEHLMWYVDKDAYYSSSSRRYLTYGNPIDWGAKDNLDKETQALKSALSIAHVLNRTLILPAFHCPAKCKDAPCKNPGNRCALNTFYKISNFDSQFGGLYREHVFLKNSMVPEGVKHSQSDTIVIEGATGTEKTQSKPEPGTPVATFSPSQPGQTTRNELFSWLATEPFSKISVLHFHSLYGDWSSLVSGDSDSHFREKLRTAFKRATYRQFDVKA